MKQENTNHNVKLYLALLKVFQQNPYRTFPLYHAYHAIRDLHEEYFSRAFSYQTKNSLWVFNQSLLKLDLEGMVGNILLGIRFGITQPLKNLKPLSLEIIEKIEKEASHDKRNFIGTPFSDLQTHYENFKKDLYQEARHILENS